MDKYAPIPPQELAACAVEDTAPDEAGRIAKAKDIVASCRAIAGTIAETYLGATTESW